MFSSRNHSNLIFLSDKIFQYSCVGKISLDMKNLVKRSLDVITVVLLTSIINITTSIGLAPHVDYAPNPYIY